MYSKSLLVFLVVYFLSDFSHGQRNLTFFRPDYHYIEAVEAFYKIHTVSQKWTEAKRLCELEGATLFYPENTDEANAVISFWKSTQSTIPEIALGISDIMGEGVFETVDGKPISEVYHNWNAGEPNDCLGKEDCVFLNKRSTLYDYPCDRLYNFICKKSLRMLEWNYMCNMSNLDYIYNEDIGKCYKFHTMPLNWHEAYAMCGIEQAHLAVIDSQQEADYLAQLTESAPKQKAQGNYLRGIYHLGFHNKFNEGWKTVTGLPMNDSTAWWGDYQPDGNEQCGSMFYTGRLTHVDCNTKSFFVCQKDLDTSNYVD